MQIVIFVCAIFLLTVLPMGLGNLVFRSEEGVPFLAKWLTGLIAMFLGSLLLIVVYLLGIYLWDKSGEIAQIIKGA